MIGQYPIIHNLFVGAVFTVDHAMICQREGLVIQCHSEIRDLQAKLLDMDCYDVQVEPALQPITGQELARRTNQAQLLIVSFNLWKSSL